MKGQISIEFMVLLAIITIIIIGNIEFFTSLKKDLAIHSAKLDQKYRETQNLKEYALGKKITLNTPNGD